MADHEQEVGLDEFEWGKWWILGKSLLLNFCCVSIVESFAEKFQPPLFCLFMFAHTSWCHWTPMETDKVLLPLGKLFGVFLSLFGDITRLGHRSTRARLMWSQDKMCTEYSSCTAVWVQDTGWGLYFTFKGSYYCTISINSLGPVMRDSSSELRSLPFCYIWKVLVL